ncbi:MAG: tetratricopeptide repeat protein [Halobacteriota archaeon]|nr:tetratricopeptide repeat protein [Halobacteriota archaeon]
MSEIGEIEGLLKRGEIEEALKFAQSNVDNPDFLARELIFKGNRLGEIREYDLSINYLDFSSKIASDVGVKGYAISCAAFEKALKKVESITFFNCALGFHNNGNFDEAIKNYNKAIFIEPDMVMAYINRGTAYYSKGMYDEAIEDYNRALDLDPENASTYNNRGSVYFDLKIYDLALEDLSRAIDLDPEDPQLYNNRAQVYMDLNWYEDAIRDYDTVVSIDPDFVDVIMKREEALAKLNVINEDPGLKIGNEVLDVANADNIFEGDYYYNKEKEYRKAIYSHINLESSHNSLGVVLSRRGDFKGAIIEFESAIKLSEKSIFYNNLGCAQADYGRGSTLAPIHLYKARKNLLKAIKDDATYVNGFRNLSLVDQLLRSELKLFSIRSILLFSFLMILLLSLPDAAAQIIIGAVAVGFIIFNLDFPVSEFRFHYDYLS